MRICFVCAVVCHSRCQNCEAVYYCSKTCQQSHWKSHIKVIDSTHLSYFLFFLFSSSILFFFSRILVYPFFFFLIHSLTHSLTQSLNHSLTDVQLVLFCAFRDMLHDDIQTSSFCLLYALYSSLLSISLL